MKLIETIDIQTMDDGIFTTIRTLDSVGDTPLFPWLDDTTATEYDLLYYLQHSGEKCISRYFKTLRKLEDESVIVSAITLLAKTIMGKFSDKWNRLHSAFIETVYKPLENYDMTQKETPNVTHTKNVKSNLETDNDFYGFNSVSAVKQSKTTVHGAKLDNEETNSETGTRDLTRHGNIGVTTSQQMLQSEIDLRNRYNFLDDIMNDVDSILCLLVY